MSYVASNPPDKNDIKQIANAFIVIAFSPLFSYVQHFMGLYLQLKLRLLPHDQTYVTAEEDLKRTLNRHIKLELGLETVYQMAMTLILLLLSYTQTPVEKGLKTVFNEGLEPLSIGLLIASTVLSAISFTSSHCKVLNVCREHFPFTSRFIAYSRKGSLRSPYARPLFCKYLVINSKNKICFDVFWSTSS